MRPGGCEISWSCMFVYITRRSSLSMEKSKDDFTSYFDKFLDLKTWRQLHQTHAELSNQRSNFVKEDMSGYFAADQLEFLATG